MFRAPAVCGLDWTEHIHTCVGVHVADGTTNNDGEWMAVLRAAQYISEYALTDVEIITH
jgi:ribonuclease HI